MSDLAFGWRLWRYPLLWGSISWLGFMILLGVSISVLIFVPDKWDRAIVIGMCGDRPVLQQENGSIWLRMNGLRAYRVEGDWKEICK
jgi:hypothetical protein